MDGGAWWAAVHGVTKSRTQLSDFIFTFHFQALEKEMATHSSVLAWRIPGTAEPGGLPSVGSHRAGHDCSDLAAANMYPEYNSGSKRQRTCPVLTERSSSPTIDVKCIFLIPLKNILKTRVHSNCSVQFPFIIEFFPLSILLTKLGQGNKLLWWWK